jgi:hypothetical protein
MNCRNYEIAPNIFSFEAGVGNLSGGDVNRSKRHQHKAGSLKLATETTTFTRVSVVWLKGLSATILPAN